MIDLADVKNELGVTYDDPAVDDRIARIIERADSHIRSVVGAESEDVLSGTEEQLVFDCCRYIYNGAFEDFDNNFCGAINGARAARLAKSVELPDAEPEDGDDSDD